MVNLNRVDYLILQGNTYGNLPGIKAVGGIWDNGSKYWKVKITGHPLNNTKQRKKLESQLNALEEHGVRFTYWYLDGVVK